VALAQNLLGKPKHLQLLDGDTDVFGDGSEQESQKIVAALDELLTQAWR
jgi:hypothetical protein